MALFKSGNPALRANTFNSLPSASAQAGEAMTLEGTVNKCGILLTVLVIFALYTWYRFNLTFNFRDIAPLFYTGLIGGFGVAVVISFRKEWAPYLGAVYAGLEGLALGGLSALLDDRYPGIAIQALLLTVGIFIALLVIYKLEIIKPTENFKLIVTAATAGLVLYYLISLGLAFFGVSAPLIHDNGPWGMAFSLLAIALASMNLVVDFDFIEQGVRAGAPRYMEWYGAFGLTVTIVWLYVELLRLLAKIRRR